MKKILNLMIAFVCVLSCAVVFAGCNITRCEHTASDEWFANDTHHWHECTECGEKVDIAEHDWEESNIVTEATPTEDGERVYICEICDSSKIDSYSITKVTEDEYAEALRFMLLDKVDLSVQVGDVSHTIINDGDLVYINSNPAEVFDGYYLKDGNKYYCYKQQSGVWIRTEIDGNTYDEANSAIDFGEAFAEMGLEFSNFVYNAETHAYEALDFEIYFVNGKATKIIINNYDGDTSSIWTIGYNDVELELPDTKKVTEQMFYDAMDMSTISNYRMLLSEEELDGTPIVSEGSMTKDGDIMYYQNLYNNDGYYSKEGNKYYVYMMIDENWAKFEISQENYGRC